MALDQLSSTAYGTRVAQGYGADGGYLGPQESGAYSNNPFNNAKSENPMESGMGGGSLNASGMNAIIASGGAPPGTDSGSTTPGSTLPTDGGDGAGDEFGAGGVNAQTTLGYGNTENVVGGGEPGVGQPHSPGPLGEFTDETSGIVDINNLANGQTVDEFGQVVSPTTEFSFLGAIGELFNVPSIFGLPPMLSPGEPTIHGQASEWEDHNQQDQSDFAGGAGDNLTGTVDQYGNEYQGDNADISDMPPANTTAGEFNPFSNEEGGSDFTAPEDDLSQDQSDYDSLSGFFGGEEEHTQGAPFGGAINAMEPTTPQDSGQDDISTPTPATPTNNNNSSGGGGSDGTSAGSQAGTSAGTEGDGGPGEAGGLGGPSGGSSGSTNSNDDDSSCFIAGTMVRMSDGTSKLIEDIVIGDQLEGMSGVVNTVVALDQPKLGTRLLWSINGTGYFVTSEHPFMTQEGWKSLSPEATAQENPNLEVLPLVVDDWLDRIDGNMEQVETVDYAEFDSETPLYNFILDGNNTYYADGYLVHNKAGDGDGGGGGGGKGGGCFIAGSMVTMEDGSKQAIETVVVGDKLQGVDGSINEVLVALRPLLGEGKLYSMNGSDHWYTADHPFMTEDGWKALEPLSGKHANLRPREMVIGDKIVQADGSLKELKVFDGVEAPDDTQLYNFKLTNTMSYFVNNNLVHNIK